ncbi:hypothetical protein RRG08_065114 [Elysia crispata]|uniref:Uncharacterized protein n=1 Tax=Elysia crispata TaxID=231223 RepID=A0AAE1DDG5_9GAST|nr:hypothetical protein RRG08_065114 [Elysia crispata]
MESTIQVSGGRVTHNVSRHRVRARVQQARCQVDVSHTMCQGIESEQGVNKPGVRWTTTTYSPLEQQHLKNSAIKT